MTTSVDVVAARTQALLAALSAGGDQLPPKPRQRARTVAEQVKERTQIGSRHTVVGLAGATGSGKSSLFNALLGAPVAEVGARRPITSVPHGAIWGDDSAGDLLDWLGVTRRHRVQDSSPEILGSLDGLVLLDLPDFDSRVLEHRAEAIRVLDRVDLFIWVTDPQKYADAVLHDDFIAARAAHRDVTLVVLNHSDSLSPAGLKDCYEDLVRLLERDGLTNPDVLVTSARSGYGVATLRQRVAAAVAARTAAVDRLSADLSAAATGLQSGVALDEPEIDEQAGAHLVSALARAAGVPVVLKAVEQDFLREAVEHTGWVFTRWSRAFSPEPLRRLHLERVETRDGVPVGEADIRAVLGRSSIPPPTPAARAEVDLATTELGVIASRGLPTRWAQAVRDVASPSQADMHDALDAAVVSTPLRGPRPFWWTLFAGLQWLCALAVLVGFLWYAAALVSGGFGWSLPRPQTWGILPYPVVLLVGGLLAGMALAALSRALARVGARRRRALIAGRLDAAITDVAERHVIEPVAQVLARHRVVREHLAQARGGAEAA